MNGKETHFVPHYCMPAQVALLALEDTELQSPPEEYLVTMYGSDVVLSDVENGQVVALISCGEGEVRELQIMSL